MATQVSRVFDLLPYNLEKFPKEKFISGKYNGAWRHFSTEEFCSLTDQLSRGLLQIGVNKSFKIGVMSQNRVEWNISDFAINQLGAYHVPLYPTLSAHDLQFIFNDAEIQLVFVETEELYLKVKQVGEALGKALDIYTFNEVEGAKHWMELVELGRSFQDLNLQSHRDQVGPEDVLTLIYTSGTTGTPKGVMLTHRNLVENFKHSSVMVPQDVRRVLSFLPLSHIFERMVIYMYMYAGMEVHYAESMETIVADIQYVQPHAFTTVPRLLEKVFDKIIEKGKALSGIKRALFFWAVDLAERFDFNKGAFYNLQLSIASKLIFSKWQAALGGQIIAIISGGAALNPRLARVFTAAGMPILEGYGLTETSPVITVNHFGHTKFGTVGPTIEGVEIMIASDGEILARGHNIMKGYYKRPDLTKEVVNEEGWFHTGDIGEIVDGEYLKITDRKKEMFKTAGGKYIAPQILENKFKESTFIEQIMVLGENRKFPSALIVPNFETLKKYAEHKGFEYSTIEALLQDVRILEKYQQILQETNKEFARWEQVKRFALLPKDWSIETGEFTPKLSIRRKIILEKYNTVIDKIYKDAETHQP